jgi:AraC-like DNA-binding protein
VSPAPKRQLSLLEFVRFTRFVSELRPGLLAPVPARPVAELLDEHLDDAVMFDAIAQAMRALRAADLPLRFAATTRVEHLGVMGFAMQTAPTVLEALEQVDRFQGLTSNSGFSEVLRDGDEVRIAWRRHTPRLDLGVRVANEIVIAQQLTLAQQLGLRGPMRVTFRHVAPDDARAHHAFFGCPVRWGAPADSIVWPATALARPLPLADAALHRFIGAEAARRLDARPPSPDGLEPVRRALARALPSADVSLEAVAGALRCTPRSLQRSLRAAGTTFRDLLDDVRRQQAQALLAAGTLSATEVAMLLGFSELSAFSRAHRRWFGTSARAHRVKSRRAQVKSPG